MRLRPTLLVSLTAALLSFVSACGTVPPEDEEWPFEEDAGLEQQDAGVVADAGVPLPPTTFKVVTWNVENLFDEQNDPNTDDTVETRATVEARLDEIAKVLESLGPPEIIALQEVENAALLRRLANRLSPNLNTVLIDGNDPRGIDVGLITRFPVKRQNSHATENVYDLSEPGKYYRYARDCLEVHLDVEGRPVVMLVNHLVSKASPGSDAKRRAEAAKTRDIADYLRGEDPNRAVIIAGDMNDTPDSPPLKQFTRTPEFVDIGASTPCTFKFGASCFRYDYLLPDRTTAQGRGEVKVIKTTDAARASDHSPVMATFTLSN